MGMLKRHEMQVLLKAGHSQAEVAQLTGASVRSVKRVAKEGDVAHVDDAAERRTRGSGPPHRGRESAGASTPWERMVGGTCDRAGHGRGRHHLLWCLMCYHARSGHGQAVRES